MAKIIPVIMYQYSSVTGEFLGVCSVEFNTETQAYLNAVNCTHIAPPMHSQPHEIAVFRDNIWQLVPDYRRVPLWDTNTRENLTFELGETPDFSHVTTLPPSSATCEWVVYNGVGMWSKPIEELKVDKFKEIKEAWSIADTKPCVTKVKDSNGNFISVQYMAYDREVWQKSIIGIVLEMVSSGNIQLIDADTESVEGVIYITMEELISIQLGTIPATVFMKIKDIVTIIRDAYDTYHTITLEQMQQIAICQNLKMKEDLLHKWNLENMINSTDDIGTLMNINWETVAP